MPKRSRSYIAILLAFIPASLMVLAILWQQGVFDPPYEGPCEALNLETDYISGIGTNGKSTYHHYLYSHNYHEECFANYHFVRELIYYSDTVKRGQPVSSVTICSFKVDFQINSTQEGKKWLKSHIISIDFEGGSLFQGERKIESITFWNNGKPHTVELLGLGFSQ